METPYSESKLMLIFACCMVMLALPACDVGAQPAELRDYRITVDPAEFDSILANPGEDIYIDCVFEYNDEVWDDTRIRLRGESSREYPKKSYKINFRSESRFFLRDKVNLVSCWLDPTYIQEHLSYHLYHRAGLRAGRTWFVRLFVNGAYLGLYLDVEQIDEHFLDYTDLPDDASIYKADVYGAQLAPDEDLEDLWEKETNTGVGYGDLAALRDWVNSAPAADFDQWLPAWFDPDTLARVIALNSLIGNQSTYYHNYFLIHDVAGSGTWRYLPWDMDRTFIYWDDFRRPLYYRCGHQLSSQGNSLIVKCWRNEKMRERILAQFRHLSATLVDGPYIEEYVAHLQTLLYNSVVADTFRQYSLQMFLDGTNLMAERIRCRRDTVLVMMETEPSPFLARPAFRTTEGYYLSWTPSVSPVGRDLEYVVSLSDNRDFLGAQDMAPVSDHSLLLAGVPDGMLFWQVSALDGQSPSLQSLVYVDPLPIDSPVVDGTVLGSHLREDVELTAQGSPYLLPAGLVVEEGARLEVDAGAVVRLGSEVGMIVHGEISARGTASDSILFESIDPEEYWNSILIHSGPDSVVLEYVTLRGGGGPTSDTLIHSVMLTYDRELRIRDSYLQGGYPYTHGIVTIGCDVELTRIRLELPVVSDDEEDNHPDIVYLIEGEGRVTDCDVSKSVEGSSGDLLEFTQLDSLWVEGCTVTDAGDDGIDVNYAGFARITNCSIVGCGDNGMSLGGISDLYAANILLRDCESGFFLKSGTAGSIYNSVMHACETGIRFDHDRAPGSIQVYNAVFSDDVSPTETDGVEGALSVDYSAVSGEAALPGTGNLAGYLGLMAPGSGDFRLRPDSPLIDAGFGTGSPARDARDSSRVDIDSVENRGAGEPPYVDIGLYEFHPDVDTPPPPVPADFAFVRGYPNPFNALTTLQLGMVSGGDAELTIYDRLGRRLFGRTLCNLNAGVHTVQWNGCTTSGTRVASGVYFVRLRQPAGSAHGKLVLIR